MDLRFTRHVAVTVTMALLLAGCDRLSSDELLARADQALLAGDYRSAIVDLKTVVAAEPSNAKARWLLADTYLQTYDGASAEKELLQARARGVNEEAVAPALALARHLQGRHEKVLEVDLDGLPSAPKAEVIAYQVLAHLALGNAEATRALMNEAETLGPDLAPVKYARARLLVEAQQSDEAMAAAEALTRLHPDFAPGWALLGDLATVSRRFDDAEAAYTRAIDRGQDLVRNLAKRGAVRTETGDLDGTLKDASVLARLAPDQYAGHFLTGLVRFRQGDYPAAQQAFEKSLSLAPDHFDTLIAMSTLLFRTGEVNRGRQLVDRAIRQRPRSVAALRLRAAWQIRDGQASEAEPALRAILRSRPDDVAAKKLLVKSLTLQRKHQDATGLLAELASDDDFDSTALGLLTGANLLVTGETSAAIEKLTGIATSEPDNLAVRRGLIVAYLQNGDPEGATNVADQFLADHPEDPAAINLAGSTRLATDDLSGALEHFRDTLSKDPGNPTASAVLAAAALDQGNAQTALARIDAALKRHPDDLRLLLVKAEAAGKANDSKLRRSALRSAIDARPDLPGPRVLLARMVLDEGQPDQALDILAPVANSEQPGVLLTRAEANTRLTRHFEAQRDLEKLAAELLPNSVDVRLQLARTYGAQGERQKQRRVLERLVELAPEDPRAQISLAKIALSQGRVEDARMALAADSVQKAHTAPSVLETRMELKRLERDSEGEVEIGRELFAQHPTADSVTALARAYRRADAPDEAEALLTKWIADNGEDLVVLAELASLYQGIGKTDQAITMLRRILLVDEGNVYALNNLAWHLRNESPAKAAQLVQRAYQLAPDQAAIVDTYAGVLAVNQDYAGALRLIDEFLERTAPRGKTTLHLRRAEMLHLSGDKESAAAELREILDRNPAEGLRDSAAAYLAKITR